MSALFLSVQTKPALSAEMLRCEDGLWGQRLMECLESRGVRECVNVPLCAQPGSVTHLIAHYGAHRPCSDNKS